VFVIDGETRIEKVLKNAAKEFDTPVEIAGYLRFAVGEGIDKPTEDFAAEVNSVAGN
jgi:elongation factor Ts